MTSKLISTEKAAALVKNGDTITIAGFVGTGVPDELLIALEKRFFSEGNPRELTLLFSAGPGDGKFRGLNRLAHIPLVKRIIGGHFGLIPKLGKLALNGEIEAYNIPQGLITHLYRDIASGKPGVFTKIGIGTFADPRIEGGKVNKNTHEDLIKIIDVEGEEYLFIKTFPINIAIIRGTTADFVGNISMEREALRLDNLAQAMAAKNSGGIVIAQVEKFLTHKKVNARKVEIPGAMVDAVVISKPENHLQTYDVPYSPYLDGTKRNESTEEKSVELGLRKIVARRALLELPKEKKVVNLGIGMPETIADVAREEGRINSIILTAEAGVIGGQPAGGLSFGGAYNTDAIMSQNQQFDFYDGGGIELAFLGMAQVSIRGDVNVSRFSDRLSGAGGFVNISSSAKNVVFCGTFTAGGLKIDIEDGSLRIQQEGESTKFINQVQQITFSGSVASSLRKPVKYITERCVFELVEDQIELIEVASGIDIEKDILKKMEFLPLIRNVKLMDSRIFQQTPMRDTKG